MIENTIILFFSILLLAAISFGAMMVAIETDNVNNNKKLNKNEVTKNQEWIKKN